MPTLTPNFQLQKPLVNDPTDEDLWGGELNSNFDVIDSNLKLARDTVVTAKTADYPILVTDRNGLLTMDATVGARVFTLPTAASAGNGFRVSIKKIDASLNTVTIDGSGSETIDGSANYILTIQNEFVTLVSNGTGWNIVSSLTTLPSGSVVSSASAFVGSAGPFTSIIPWDNTIPQITEGTEIITLSYTPKSATNIIRIKFLGGYFSTVATNVRFSAAMFKDAGANALIAAANSSTNNGDSYHMPTLVYEEVAGSTTARTYKIRVGLSNANNTSINNVFGGISRSFLIIDEIKA